MGVPVAISWTRESINFILRWNTMVILGSSLRLLGPRTKKTMEGEAALAFLNISRTARSDSPTYLFKSWKACSVAA